MVKINYILSLLRLNKTYLPLFVCIARSYLLPILFSIIVCVIYIIYFGPVYLCDDGDSLNQMKLDLTLEVARYRIATVNYEMYIDLKNQISNLPSNTNNDLDILGYKVSNSLQEMRDSLNNAQLIETNIRRLEPDFRSPITTINYLRIGR
jgi:hypothetical protein